MPPYSLVTRSKTYRGYVKPQVMLKGKGKSKVLPRTGHEGPEEEQMYISTLPSTSALDGVSGQRHAPAALSPGRVRKISPHLT